MSCHFSASAKFHLATFVYLVDHSAVAFTISAVDTTHIQSISISVSANTYASFDIVGQASATANAVL